MNRARRTLGLFLIVAGASGIIMELGAYAFKLRSAIAIAAVAAGTLGICLLLLGGTLSETSKNKPPES